MDGTPVNTAQHERNGMSSTRTELRIDQPAAAQIATPRVGLDRRWLVSAVALVVFAISFAVNVTQIRETTFHPDESRWINRAHYLTDLGTPLGSEWADRYLLRGQPPFGSYVTALGLLLQGQDTETNQPFDFHFGNERLVTWEAGHNAIPTQADLLAARRMNAFIGALTSALIVVVLAKITTLAGAIIGGAFVLSNDLHQYLSSTALSDATLGLILVLMTLLLMRLVKCPGWGKTTLLGVLIGCGMAAKLSPIALALGLAVIGAVFIIRPLLRRIPRVGQLIDYLAHGAEHRIDRLGWMLLSLPAIASATFVLLYPYVWSAPFSRTRILFDFRAQEMASQSRIWPDRAVIGRLDALQTLWHVFQQDYPTTGRFFDWLAGFGIFPQNVPSIDIILAGIGLVLAIVAVIRNGVVTPLSFAFILLGGQAAAIAAGLRVDFNRYYLPIVLFVGLCIGYLAGEIARACERWVAERRAARCSSEPTSQTDYGSSAPLAGERP
jgi:hypothetical protein